MRVTMPLHRSRQASAVANEWKRTTNLHIAEHKGQLLSVKEFKLEEIIL